MCNKLVYLISFVLVLSMAGKGWPGVSKPNPADGTLHEDTWINLSWQSGSDAASYDVYFDENFDNVNDGTGEAFRGNQTGAFFVAGFPGFPYPDGLVPGTTYYWRIDEIQTDGTTVHRGSIWSFTIPSKTAKNPDPADGAEFVDPNTLTLSWTEGFGAKLHTVYLGDDFVEMYDDIFHAAASVQDLCREYKLFLTPEQLDAVRSEADTIVRTLCD